MTHHEMVTAIEKAKRLIVEAKLRGKSDGFSRYRVKSKERKQ